VDYSKLTVQELQMIKIPEDSDLSWMYCGVKVVRGNGRKAQMPGFPDCEHSSQQAKGHWYVETYLVVLETRPCEAMSENRIRVLNFHRRNERNSAALRMLERIVDAMLKYAQEVWERDHWVTIDKASGELSELEYKERVARRTVALREYNAIMKRAFATPGLPETMRFNLGSGPSTPSVAHGSRRIPESGSLGPHVRPPGGSAPRR